MLVFISLLLLFLAGIVACGTPPHILNLETSLGSGKLALWMSMVRAFGVPLSLLILRFTKNNFIKLACALWGTFMTLFSIVIIFGISRNAPSVNFYGILFVLAVLICSASVAIFSWIQISTKLAEVLYREKRTNPTIAVGSSSQIEGAYQTPTNPS